MIYRVFSFKGLAWTHRYLIDGRHRLDLRANQYGAIAVAPGTRIVNAGTESRPDGFAVTIEAQAGETYFVEDYPGFNLSQPDRLTRVERERAEDMTVRANHPRCHEPVAE